MAAKNLFEYAVILHARPSKDNAGNDTTPDSTVLIAPTQIIAASDNHALRIASRQIPKRISDSDLALVEIKIRQL